MPQNVACYGQRFQVCHVFPKFEEPKTQLRYVLDLETRKGMFKRIGFLFANEQMRSSLS